MTKLLRKLSQIVILGGGYAYHEIFGLIQDINSISPVYEIVGILDDNPELYGEKYNGIVVSGPLTDWSKFPESVKFVLAIGSYNTRFIRWSIVERLSIPAVRYISLIHPSAKIYDDTIIGPGCVIHYGSLINSKTVMERNVLVSGLTVIGVDNFIGEGTLIASSVVTTTKVRIGSYSFLGAGAIIGPEVRVGAGAMVSAGSVVLKNVKVGENTLGNPSRVFRRDEVPSKIIELDDHQ